VQHQRVLQISARQSGFDEAMREPREFESPLCAQSGGDFWFPEPGLGQTQEAIYARSICNQCVHQTECAEWGIYKERYGIWGGLSEFQRKQIRRSRNIIFRQEESA
jgi:WhiB family redox-sensing transcriptional regulator